MKIILLLIFVNATGIAFCQPIDSTIKRKYDSIYNILPAEMKIKFEEVAKDSFNNSFISFVHCVRDTLNKNDIVAQQGDASVTGVTIDGDADTLQYEEPIIGNNYYTIWLAGGGVMSDSLLVELSSGFFQGYTVKANWIHGKLDVIFNNYRKYDSIYKATPDGGLTNDLNLQVRVIKFSLSDPVFTDNKALYIEAEMITEPFWEEDSFFKDGYIKQKVHISFLYKISNPLRRLQPGRK